MTITPKRRRKLNQEQHQRQRHKEIKHNSDAMLLGQSGGAPVDALSVDILPEGGGYYTIKVKVPINIAVPPLPGGGAGNPINEIYCDSIINVSLVCPKKYISYEKGSVIMCEIISSNNDVGATGVNIVAITSDDDAGTQASVPIPYTETAIKTISNSPNSDLTNDFKAIGEPDPTTFGTSKWSFLFNIENILKAESGPIHDLIEENTRDQNVISKFITFTDTANIVLTFKNIRLVADTIPKEEINIIFKVKNGDGNVGNITDAQILADIRQNIKGILDFNTLIPLVDKVITEKFEGNDKIINDFLKKCAITSNGGIIDITLVQLIFIFFYTIIPDSVRRAKCAIQDMTIGDGDNQQTSNNLFKQFYNNQTFFNFLSLVYMSTNKISNSRDLSFQRIFNNMRSIAPDYKDKGVSPDLLYTQGGQGGGAIGDENDTSSNDMFKKISRIIPMQIDKFNDSPQNMVVTITIPKITEPLCGSNLREDVVAAHAKANPLVNTLGAEGAPEDASESLMDSINSESGRISSRGSVASSESSEGNKSVSGIMSNNPLFKVDNQKQKDFINSNNQATQKYIDQSLTEGKIDVQVGDCVQFILDGKLVKAIICFFKSGKYTYDNKFKIKYEAASNIVDYWRSLEGKIQTVVNEKEREPLNLISLLNLRGFAFLPYQENDDKKTYTILYDCKSEIKRLHNGYNPGKVSQAFKSFANTLIPVSTEFTVESLGALQFNTASYMTLRKIDDPPEAMKEFSAHLQSLGMADEGTITKSIQTYIQQYGLSKLCGKMVSPTDVNRQNLFKQKVMNVDREFYSSGVFNTRVNQYNVYKSNIFIQGLLTEKISSEDSIALFQSVYDPAVPELIYWFFTAFARGSDTFAIDNPTRAMIMVFQAFAHNGEAGEFNIALLNTLPGNEAPGEANFTTGQAGGAPPGGDGDGGGGGEEGGEEEEEAPEEEEEEVENNGGTASSVDPISNYIKRLIDIVKKNGLYDVKYLNTLMSALKAAKIKYKSKIDDDRRLFSASTADPERAEAAMQQHINNANQAAKKAAEDAKKAKDAAEKKAADADTLAHTRRKELLEASHGAISKGKGAFDLSHLLKSKDGSNIDNQLGTCISGNNVVISCDGQTVRIDLDLATLLSTCADSFTQSALNGIGKKDDKSEEDGGDGGGGGGGGGGDGGEEEEGEEEEGEGDGDDEEEEDDGTGGKGSGSKPKPKAAAAPVTSSSAAAVTSSGAAKPVTGSIASSVDAEYKAYDTDYQKFKRDPVARYLDYDAEVKTFMQEYQEFLDDPKKKLLEIPTEADKKKIADARPDTVFNMTAQ